MSSKAVVPISPPGARRSLRRHRQAGFTIGELMVTVAVIGILSTVAIANSGNEWRRERTNTVATELAAWLEAIRANSQRLSGSYCNVTFNTTPASKVAGDVLATVDQLNATTNATITPQACSLTPNFRISAFSNSPDTYNVALAPTTPATLSFNPRGAVSATTNTDLKIQLAGSPQLRCVRTTATAGLIRIGSNNAAASTAAACTSFIAF